MSHYNPNGLNVSFDIWYFLKLLAHKSKGHDGRIPVYSIKLLTSYIKLTKLYLNVPNASYANNVLPMQLLKVQKEFSLLIYFFIEPNLYLHLIAVSVFLSRWFILNICVTLVVLIYSIRVTYEDLKFPGNRVYSSFYRSFYTIAPFTFNTQKWYLS